MPTTMNISKNSSSAGFSSEVKMSGDVIATVVALATIEVEGIAGLLGTSNVETIKKLGIKNSSRGVSVSLDADKKCVNCKISAMMKYGYSIPEVCNEVQEKVALAVETMTGLKAGDVFIDIVDVKIPEK